MNTKSSLVQFLFVFLVHSQYFCCYVHFHQFLLQVYSQENINQSYKLTCCVVCTCFLLQMNLLFYFSDLSLVKVTSYCLNPNLVLNLCAVCCSTIHNSFGCQFFDYKNYVVFFFRYFFFGPFCSSYDRIFLLFVFHSATILHHYLLLFIHHFLHTFLCLYQPYLNNVCHKRVKTFVFFFYLVVFS